MARETETIHLNLNPEGSPQYVPVQAYRTLDGFFEIASAPLEVQSNAFKVGDTVRCAWRYYGSRFEGLMVAISLANQKLSVFHFGDKVLVSEHAGWNNSFVGTVCSGPESDQVGHGPTTHYLVSFDEPQLERSQEDEYIKAQISSVYLERVA